MILILNSRNYNLRNVFKKSFNNYIIQTHLLNYGYFMKAIPILTLFSTSLLALSIAAPLPTWAMGEEHKSLSTTLRKSKQNAPSIEHTQGRAEVGFFPPQEDLTSLASPLAEVHNQQAAPSVEQGEQSGAADVDTFQESLLHLRSLLTEALAPNADREGGWAVGQQPQYRTVLAEGRLSREEKPIIQAQGGALSVEQRRARPIGKPATFHDIPKSVLSKIFSYVCAMEQISVTGVAHPPLTKPWYVDFSTIRQVCWNWRGAIASVDFWRPAILNSWRPGIGVQQLLLGRELIPVDEWVPSRTFSTHPEHTMIALRQLTRFYRMLHVFDSDRDSHPFVAHIDDSLVGYACDVLHLPFAFHVREFCMHIVQRYRVKQHEERNREEEITQETRKDIEMDTKGRLYESYLDLPGWPLLKQFHLSQLLLNVRAQRVGGPTETMKAIAMCIDDETCPLRALALAARLSVRVSPTSAMLLKIEYSSDPQEVRSDLTKLNELICQGNPVAVTIAGMPFTTSLMLISLMRQPNLLTFNKDLHKQEVFAIIKEVGIAHPPKGHTPPLTEMTARRGQVNNGVVQQYLPAPVNPPTQQAHGNDVVQPQRPALVCPPIQQAHVEEEDFNWAVLNYWQEQQLKRLAKIRPTAPKEDEIVRLRAFQIWEQEKIAEMVQMRKIIATALYSFTQAKRAAQQ
jgi:hypothetical protein